jgi:hypothetical protein
VNAACGHLLCDLIGGTCSLATGRSRGCRPNLTAREVAPEILDEVRALLAAIEPSSLDERGRAAAVRLAQIVRREALDDRNLVAIALGDELEFAPALARLCAKRR